eukprot:scaffold32223_cov107-Isochrysis_galbana.AAC.2
MLMLTKEIIKQLLHHKGGSQASAHGSQAIRPFPPYMGQERRYAGESHPQHSCICPRMRAHDAPHAHPASSRPR